MRPTKNRACWSPLPTVNSASFFPEFRIIANSDQQKENDDQQETTAYFYLIHISVLKCFIFCWSVGLLTTFSILYRVSKHAKLAYFFF